MSKECYVSVDIESVGPCPGLHSMLSFGSVAYLDDQCIAEFTANLIELPDCTRNEKTMTEFWDKNTVAWEACRQDLQDPADVMPEYAAWLKALPGKPIFVGYPAAFDFGFINYYLHRFAGENPFGFSAFDIKSYASAVLKKPYSKTTKSNMPKRWFVNTGKHTHLSLDDAKEQAVLLLNIMKENIK